MLGTMQAILIRGCIEIEFSSMSVQDSYRFLGLGGGNQHLGGSGSRFPQELFLKTNALRLILGHFLVHMHILANIKYTDFNKIHYIFKQKNRRILL